MNTDILLLFVVLLFSLIGFVSGIVRYDIVALLALMSSVLLGLVPFDEAFSGFGHPAVITVAAVLVVSRAFFRSGLVEKISVVAISVGENKTLQVLALTMTVAVLSAFMNNVGALALMLPVGLRVAQTHGMSPSMLLMPLSFGSLLGGLTTMIGTPPNIIVANYTSETSAASFGLFDFTPVGFFVALFGVLFIGLVGWRILPYRKGQSSAEDRFEIDSYLAELRVKEGSKIIGLNLKEIFTKFDMDATVLAILRGDKRLSSHLFYGALKEDDVLLVEGDTEEISKLADELGLTIGFKSTQEESESDDNEEKKKISTKDLDINEVVVMANSKLIGKTVSNLRLFHNYNIHLIAVSRNGQRLKTRLRKIVFQNGDVLLLQGSEADLSEQLAELRCLPLADRNLNLGISKKFYLAGLVFGLSITAIVMGWLSAPVSLMLAAVVMVVINVIDLENAYDSIDLPVVVLLAAMIPVGAALETTGGATMIAEQILDFGKGLSPILSLAVLLVVTMFLSDIINNAAAAVLMAPIGVKLAQGLSVNSEPFLMAVAIGASCAFLTPIGHQSNTLVFGPGGYKFSDYWKLGLPVQIIVFALAIPLLVWFWPL